ncbi:VMAP-C domain-containing protein [Streptomyces sp. BE230]|uniref:VMAP-C domain-containing protein n=1 Tax=Streptomyces sp. BE230 TaxID=3002526 RepID=UPI002ED61707|nr:trypsin-like peptidase domain-containing protein [Streptomyces sp. BE230]
MDLVRDSTVRIHRPGSGYVHDGPVGDFLGSGFFIAPNWILTCAHVAMRGEGGMVNVWFKGDRYSTELSEVPGKVVAAMPGALPPGAVGWPAPDLALIKLQRPAEHTCVYVTERSEAMLRSREIHCVGWAASQGGGLLKRSGVCVVKGAYGASDDAEQVVRLDGDWLEPGMSGGPVVDLVRGEVVGVIKSRLDNHQGGTAVGTERLRTLKVPSGPVETEADDVYQSVFHAHDRYHADRHNSSAGTERTWADVQSELPLPPGGVLGPKQRVDLLGRLAELPPPASTRSLLVLLDTLPGVHSREHRPAPRGWRDGLAALYDTRARERVAQFELVLRYCMGVLTADRPSGALYATNAEALWDWVQRVATAELPRDLRRQFDREWADVHRHLEQSRQQARPPLSEPVVPVERDCVVLEVERQGWAPGQYDWRVAVARHTGEMSRIRDGQGGPLGSVPDQLSAALTEAFRECDEPGSPAMLQVVVAPALFGLEVDRWELPSDGRPLGAVRPVVLRSSEHGPTGERLTRWDSAPNTGMQAEVIDCENELRVRVPEAAQLGRLAPEAVPVLCRYGNRPDPGITTGVGRVLDAGFGVALLQRRPTEGDTVCKEFHRRVAEGVSDVRARDRLPRWLHELRRGVSAARTETYWSDGVALYYDNPHRPLPRSEYLEAP